MGAWPGGRAAGPGTFWKGRGCEARGGFPGRVGGVAGLRWRSALPPSAAAPGASAALEPFQGCVSARPARPSARIPPWAAVLAQPTRGLVPPGSCGRDGTTAGKSRMFCAEAEPAWWVGAQACGTRDGVCAACRGPGLARVPVPASCPRVQHRVCSFLTSLGLLAHD